MIEELRARFPWLDTDEEVSGADVVDQLCRWYREEVSKPPEIQTAEGGN